MSKNMVEPRTHDLSMRAWGRNYNILKIEDGGARIQIAGWATPRPDDGDFLILGNGGETTRYQAEKVETCGNPDDMFFAECRFSPRLKP